MKRIIYILGIVYCIFLGACQKADYLLFNDVARVQLDEPEDILTDFFYIDRSITRDTVYLTVNTIGDPVNRDRKINFEQITEYDVTYEYDDKGNLVDSVLTEKPNKAVPGVHYVAMDDPEMQSLLIVPANQVVTEVPVILLRDKSLRTEEYRLALKLMATEDFMLGESSCLVGKIVFADKLSRPSLWDAYMERYYFGTYSTRKHEFMTEVSGEKIDDEWFTRVKADMLELLFYKDMFKKALYEYNNDPENIAQGLAPMRENQDDPNSPLIVFPN